MSTITSLGIWSKSVIDRNPICERCHRQVSQDAHHYIKKRHGNTRFDIKNGIALCHYCHDLVEFRNRTLGDEKCRQIMIDRGDFKDIDELYEWEKNSITKRIPKCDRRKKRCR